jgi:hypothetical protein
MYFPYRRLFLATTLCIRNRFMYLEGIEAIPFTCSVSSTALPDNFSAFNFE